MKRSALLALAAAALVAGCGGDHAQKPIVRSQAPPQQPHVRALPARPPEVALIRRWSDTLRAGHVAAASRLFHLPALAQNDGPELALQSRSDVRAFNASLPCGAVLLDARRVAGGYTLAVFRLTDRPGAACGTGTGQRAAAAFRFKGALISDWRRVPVPQFERAGPSPRI
jgi:hypothetical protein